MAGQEHLRGQSLDKQIAEPQLQQAEVGEQAHQLIQDFKQSLEHTPELFKILQKFGDERLTKTSVIQFIKKNNNTHYSLYYDKTYDKKTDKGREVLHIKRSPSNPKGVNEWLSDSAVWLGTRTTNNDAEFEKGVISIRKWGEKHIRVPRIPDNTQSAVQAVQDFLTTNFPIRNQQAQTPPQQQ